MLPETHETITFDEAGDCNVCNNHLVKKETIDWPSKKLEFDSLIEEYRGNHDYDCLVPFSGGKDSTWTLYYLVKEYGLKPLVVRFDHGFMRPNLEENVKQTIRKLGVDMISFTPNWHVVRDLMMQSLMDKGDFCWHCHTGIFSYPMWTALEKKVPLIIWGEPSSEYSAYFSYDDPEEVDEKRFNRYINLGISADDMYVRLGGTHDYRDFKPYSYPPLADLKQLKYRSVCLGSFVPWDVPSQSKIISEELGWQGDEVENVPPEYSYEKIECYMQGVRDYLKFIKRGYSRPSHLAALDLRNGKISKEEGQRRIDEFEGRRPPSLDIFLKFLNITEDEFMEIAKSNMVSPYQHDADATQQGKKTKDFDQWSQAGGMSRDRAEDFLSKWRQNSG